MRILAVSGSLRESSYNTSLLRAAIEAAPDGVELELWEGTRRAAALRRGPRGATCPSRCAACARTWADADAILFSTPEYNGSVPGGLKNAIDWASRPRLEAVLRNKPVAVVGASTGQFGALWAQQDLKRILGIAGARVVGTEIPVSRADERFDDQGRLLDGEIFEQLRLHLTTLASEAVPAPDRSRCLRRRARRRGGSSQGRDGRREARTQGALVAGGYGCDRGRSSRRSRPTSKRGVAAFQRGPAARPLRRRVLQKREGPLSRPFVTVTSA